MTIQLYNANNLISENISAKNTVIYVQLAFVGRVKSITFLQVGEVQDLGINLVSLLEMTVVTSPESTLYALAPGLQVVEATSPLVELKNVVPL